jgi:hypothetical protein
MQVKVLLARFPFGASEHPAVTNWYAQTLYKAKTDPRISDILHMEEDDTPITMSRNKTMRQAQLHGVDVVCMIDSDMVPDLIPGAPPFWETALDFLLKHDGPCCVGAPYCGKPPHEVPFAHKIAKKQGDHPNVDFSIELYTREEAAIRSGFAEMPCLPTGLILVDVRALDAIKPPWFDYEWADPPYNTTKASTEDCYFTRNLCLAGVPQYMAWDCWAGHYKSKIVGKPTVLTVDDVREQYREAILSGRRRGEALMDVRPDRMMERRLKELASNGELVV